MDTARTVGEIRRQVAGMRAGGGRIGLVPTMGALHEGHLSLIRAARGRQDRVVVSIFVNPAQFGPGEDWERYPRSLERDSELCRQEDVAAVFAPPVEEMYPEPSLTHVRVSRLTEGLCGAYRPGHFDGVTLVVAKLLNIVQPDRAYFGQKDAQQAAVIKRMVVDLNWPIEIIVCPIVREADGLAMSSRNQYLGPQQRQQALCLYRSLAAARDMVAGGERCVAAIDAAVRRMIEAAGTCTIDYVEIVDPETMQPLAELAGPALVAVAVRIGSARLIDNMIVAPGCV